MKPAREVCVRVITGLALGAIPVHLPALLAVLGSFQTTALAQTDPWNDPVSDYYSTAPLQPGAYTAALTMDIPYAHVRGGTHCGTLCDSNGNFDLTLDIYRPGGAFATTVFPILVYVHGGAFELNDKTKVSQFAIAFAEQGYVVININYRMVGSSYYACNGTSSCTVYPSTCGQTGGKDAYGPTHDGKTYVDYLDYCQQKAKQLEDASRFSHPAAVQDVRQALYFAKHNAATYYADPSKIYAYGTSAGAHLVMLAATDYEDALGGSGPDDSRSLAPPYNVIPNVVVAVSPVLDFQWAEGALAQTNWAAANGGSRACDTVKPDGTLVTRSVGSAQCGVMYLDAEAGATCTLPSGPSNFWSALGGDCALGASSKHNLVSPVYNFTKYSGTIKSSDTKMYTFNSEDEFLHYTGYGQVGGSPDSGHGDDTANAAAAGLNAGQYYSCKMPYQVSGDLHVNYFSCQAGGSTLAPCYPNWANVAWPSGSCPGWDPANKVNTVQDVVDEFFRQGGVLP